MRKSAYNEIERSVFTVIILLKCAQYLGYFPALTDIPSAIVNQGYVRDTCLCPERHDLF